MMVLPVSSQSKKLLPSAVDKCRYVRTINLLPGVEHGSSTKRGRGASNAGGEREW